MREVNVDRVSDDGRHLIARDVKSGEQFRIVADDRVRSLLAKHPLARRLEKSMDSSIRPRDIQFRIRHGATAEEVSEAAGVPVDRIMAFALPVLAERAHFAERARASALRRSYIEEPATLEHALLECLPHGRFDAGRWDAWRRDDGKWLVTLEFEDEASRAEYVFDVDGRYVVAANAVGRDLVGDTLDRPSDEMEIAQAVSARAADHDEGSGASRDPESDGSAAIHEQPVSAEPPAGVASLQRARERRAMEQLALGVDEGFSAADPPLLPEFDVDDEPAVFDSDAPAPESDSPTSEADLSDADVADVPHTDSRADDPATEPEERPKRRERRRVPSWDEIMFGNSNQS